ncbi:hypothetical protein [Aquiflexum sp.]|uniref:glycosyltransferase family 39 protein n=1 Tax=Aquiflexum sp. TaxID=1872584 RepID=UPI003593DF0A
MKIDIKTNSQKYLKDGLFLGAILVSLISSCIIMSGKKIFWNDELYSWFLLSDPSFLHMWDAFSDQINNTPPLYFLIGWPWTQLFGDSALSLRLFSALGICVALVLAWVILRRFYSFWPVAIGLALFFGTSQLILEQNAEARMYGLYLANASLALFVYDRICRARVPGRKLLLLNFLAHAVLINTHLHGTFYSGALLLSLIAYDFFHLGLRLKVYLTIIGSWLTFLFYLPAFFVQIGVSKPRGWIPEPIQVDLMNLYFYRDNFFNPSTLILIFLIVAFGYILIRRPQNDIILSKEKPADPKHLLLAAFTWVTVPLGVYLLSKFMQPIFWNRYFLPTGLGIVIILVHNFQPIIKNMGFQREGISKIFFPRNWPTGYLISRLILFLFLLALICIPLIRSISYKENPRLAGSSQLLKTHPDLPVVCQFSHYFWENLFNDNQPEKYYFILDEEGALSGRSGMFGAQEFKHMTAILRNYPEHIQDQVVESGTFLSRFDRFIVMDYSVYDKACPKKVKGLDQAKLWENIHCPQWMENEILNNPEYRITEIEPYEFITYLLVEKLQSVVN